MKEKSARESKRSKEESAHDQRVLVKLEIERRMAQARKKENKEQFQTNYVK